MIQRLDARVLEKEQQRLLRTRTPGRLAAALTANAHALRSTPVAEAQAQPDFSDPATLEALLANLKQADSHEQESPADMHALDPGRVARLLDLE